MELDPLAGRADDLYLTEHSGIPLHHIRSTHGSLSYPLSHLFSTMEIELHPTVSLLEGTLNVLVAPVEMKMPGSQATLAVFS